MSGRGLISTSAEERGCHSAGNQIHANVSVDKIS